MAGLEDFYTPFGFAALPPTVGAGGYGMPYMPPIPYRGPELHNPPPQPGDPVAGPISETLGDRSGRSCRQQDEQQAQQAAMPSRCWAGLGSGRGRARWTTGPMATIRATVLASAPSLALPPGAGARGAYGMLRRPPSLAGRRTENQRWISAVCRWRSECAGLTSLGNCLARLDR